VISGVDPSPETPTATAETATTAGPWSDLGAAAYQPENRADEVITAYPSARPGPAGAIHGVGLTVLVRDLDRSIAFYRETLGFFEIDRGEGNAVLASGDTRVVLRTVADLTSAGRLIYLNLEVGDVEAVYRELLSKGILFEHEPMVVNHGQKLELWSATFHDPDGHNIAITQWRATT
jgi:catechol 2,3-dioxygenase-like lactoylglutathione lyase family enzyme